MAGFTQQQQATMEAAIMAALGAARSEASANLAEWASKQVEMQALIQSAATEKEAMQQQMVSSILRQR